jgi:hypothetical protein
VIANFEGQRQQEYQDINCHHHYRSRLRHHAIWWFSGGTVYEWVISILASEGSIALVKMMMEYD